MQFGATFSHPYLKHLNLDPKKALSRYKDLGLTWIRLGCYWNEIEKKERKYDFSNLDQLVKYCEENNIKIVMTLGMKAPRWPEYYIPTWLEEKQNLKSNVILSTHDKLIFEKTLAFISKSLNHYKNSSAIKVWQVENEPLDPSGPENIRISHDFLLKETETIKDKDKKRQILINHWGGDLILKKVPKEITRTIDITGIDIYPKQFIEHRANYSGPKGPKILLKKKIKSISRKYLWITELQAEPWEASESLYKSEHTPSISPDLLKKNIEYVKDFNPEVILFWGFEYWLWRKEYKKDNRYWNTILQLAPH